MKWINGRTYYGRDYYRESWHKWFAWYPVKAGITGDGENQRHVKIWLAYVERKGSLGYRSYREIKKEDIK